VPGKLTGLYRNEAQRYSLARRPTEIDEIRKAGVQSSVLMDFHESMHTENSAQQNGDGGDFEV
jgi:hypothetical protein